MPAAPTSSAGSGGPSTTCSPPSTARRRPNGSSCSTPATSCARRSRASVPTSRSSGGSTSCRPATGPCSSTTCSPRWSELTNLVGDLSELARGDQRRDRPRSPSASIGWSRTRSPWPSPTAATRRRVRPGHRALLGTRADGTGSPGPSGTCSTTPSSGAPTAVRSRSGASPASSPSATTAPVSSPEDLPHVFDRFYRAAAARALPGSGLGLAIVAQVADAEGGAVTAGQAPGGGASFQMTLPAVSSPALPAAGDPAASDPTGVDIDVADE